MRRPTFCTAVALLLTAADTAALTLCNPFDPQTLAEYETSLAREHPAFPHRRPEELAASATPVLLLDVREAEEFAISHLDGAIHIAPDVSASALRRQLAALRGKLAPDTEVLFYCSVGYRSSKLAERVRKELAAAGYPRVANLRGGIFAWTNRGLPVVDADGPTRAVHPYNACFAPLLQRPPAAAPR